jgi:hypothetical protein
VPKPYQGQDPVEDLEPAEENGRGGHFGFAGVPDHARSNNGSATTLQEEAAQETAQATSTEKPPRRRQRRRRASEPDTATELQPQAVAKPSLTDTQAQDSVAESRKAQEPTRETKPKRRRPQTSWVKRLLLKLRRQSAPETDKPKRVKYTKSTRAVQWSLLALLAFLLFGAIRGLSAGSLVRQERTDRMQAINPIEAQLKDLGASSTFPLADATAKAQRLAYECFTVPNYGADAPNVDPVSAQNKALANAGVPVGRRVHCGWNGHGRGKVDAMQVVNDPYWIHNDHATVILQVKLYQRPGFFYYYVPFGNHNGIAEFAGMPAIFGTASGALDFLNRCSGLQEVSDADQLQHTAQLFLDSLTGNTDIDLGYLVYGDSGATKFGGFGPAVSSPRVTQVLYCGHRGQEKLFEAMVRFNGPVDGAHYALPYGFGVVPNAETSGRYQIKDFGPAPGYSLG